MAFRAMQAFVSLMHDFHDLTPKGIAHERGGLTAPEAFFFLRGPGTEELYELAPR